MKIKNNLGKMKKCGRKRREKTWKEGEEGRQGRIGGKDRTNWREGKYWRGSKIGVLFLCFPLFHFHLTPNVWAVNVFF